MCRDKDGSVVTDEREMFDRWKQHYPERLNGADEEDQILNIKCLQKVRADESVCASFFSFDLPGNTSKEPEQTSRFCAS